MSQALARFVEQPSGPHFRAAWCSVRKTRRKLEFARLQAWLAAGRIDEVRTELSSLPQWLKLSPRVHELAALAAEQAGDENDAEIERFLFTICVQGILASGDGSVDHPYVAVQLEDETVLLSLLGRDSFSQAVVPVGNRLLDVVLCRDGSEVCFDVTHAMATSFHRVMPAAKPRTTKLRDKIAKRVHKVG
jgi:hypothetical protein